MSEYSLRFATNLASALSRHPHFQRACSSIQVEGDPIHKHTTQSILTAGESLFDCPGKAAVAWARLSASWAKDAGAATQGRAAPITSNHRTIGCPHIGIERGDRGIGRAERLQGKTIGAPRRKHLLLRQGLGDPGLVAHGFRSVLGREALPGRGAQSLRCGNVRVGSKASKAAEAVRPCVSATPPQADVNSPTRLPLLSAKRRPEQVQQTEQA
jgi:hypothetical protein